jgi:DNA-binding MarR family transcriptional regulator
VEHRSLLRLLVECSRGLEVRLRVGLREAGYGDVRPAHYAVFRYLAPEGSRVTELAEAAGMTQQSMGEFVAHLERLGFVERRPDPRDGRARIVVPTEAGRHGGTHGGGEAGVARRSARGTEYPVGAGDLLFRYSPVEPGPNSTPQVRAADRNTCLRGDGRTALAHGCFLCAPRHRPSNP